ncbi:hypothetical protein ACFLVM_00460 [Chloroflexota bacterium]
MMTRGKIKKAIKILPGEGFYGLNNEFLIDIALTFAYPADLTYFDFLLLNCTIIVNDA